MIIGIMNRFKTYVIALLSVLFLIVAIQNVSAVEVKFLMWSFSISQTILLPLVLAIGFGIGFLVAGLRRR